jgi:hypothetical protein
MVTVGALLEVILDTLGGRDKVRGLGLHVVSRCL